MMIALSSLVYDPMGVIVFRPRHIEEVAMREASRRVTRTATLDGGVSVYDTGYAAGDRNMEVTLSQADLAMANRIKRLIVDYNRLLLVCEEGCFIVVPESYSFQGALVLKLLVLQEL